MDASPDLGSRRTLQRRPASNTVAKALPTARRATKRRSLSNNGSRENAGDDFLPLFDAHRLADRDQPSAHFIPGFPSIAGLKTTEGINRTPARSLHRGKHKEEKRVRS